MASEHHVVRQDDALADAAVVGDMSVGQENAARADLRFRSATFRARIHRHAFPDEALLADIEANRLAAILEVLRLMSDRGEGKYARPGADGRVAGEADMRDEARALAQRHMRSDVAERSDLDVLADSRAVLDHSGRMNADGHSRTSIAETSASHTSAPSTFASPRNHHMLRFLAMRVMWNLT